jgi:hypothetical protein
MHTETHQRTHHLLAQSLGQFTTLMRIVILTDELQRLVEVLFCHNPTRVCLGIKENNSEQRKKERNPSRDAARD